MPRHRIGLLSTYPPKICGLATFAAALQRGLVDLGHRVNVVRVDDHPTLTSPDHPVAGRMSNGDATSIVKAAALLSQGDVAIVQHEFGIYGGRDGREVLDLLRMLTVPSIVVLHTVPLHPTAHQTAVIADIDRLADRLVVMTDTASARLLSLYPIDPARVSTIAHGATLGTSLPPGEPTRRPERKPQLLTWGLLGPGKGIEHAIAALPQLADLGAAVDYTIAGVTHPKVQAMDGHAYRHSLERLAERLGVASMVHFDQRYRNVDDLTRFVATSNLVILPYDSRDQVTSGVLVDALAAGRPVIATEFPHALDLRRSGAVMTVPHGDPTALATAIRAVLTNDKLHAKMSSAARRAAHAFSWEAIAEEYAELADELSMTTERAAV